MQTPSRPSGLRERNRVRRSRRMERAALELALEHGADAVTVDMICESSDVSPRTLFNYFGSKEGALLGPVPEPPDDSAVGDFLDGAGTVLEDLLTLHASTFLASDPDLELFSMRRELFEREPALHAAQLARLSGKRERVARLVAQRLRAEDPALTQDEAARESHFIQGIALVTLQRLGRDWSDDGGAVPPVSALVSDAIDRIRRIVPPRA